MLLVVPLLGVLSNGVKVNDKNKTVITLTLSLLTLPLLFSIDGYLSRLEGALLLVGYFVVMKIVAVKNISWDHYRVINLRILRMICYIMLAVAVILFASNLLVTSSKNLAEFLGVAPFIFSIFALAIGTNIPEIVIAVRSVLRHKNDVALGDYMGSAIVNVFTLGMLILFHGTYTFRTNTVPIVVFGLIGYIYFVYCAHTNRKISRIESISLPLIYVVFFVFEVLANA
jgi:cation:H+ antiporter